MYKKNYAMNIKDINKNIPNESNYIYASDSKSFYSKNKIVKVIIDTFNCNKCKNYGWYINKKGYVFTIIKNHTVFLHRFLLDEKLNENDTVDHNDANKLNNTLANLYIMSNRDNLKKAHHVQQLYNTSKEIIMYDYNDNNKNMPLKNFPSQKEAVKYLNSIGIKTTQGAISNACLGRRKSAGGYKWSLK